MRRISYAERSIINLLQNHPSRRISYDSMAAQIGDFDRRTLIGAMHRLRHTGRVILVEPGRGRLPNRYDLP